ncbi:hypothetical protein HHX47_DHR6000476 [Lentinula edodes]|nr:hypothetical protein HHX47_DHR6000476 [Lentinula edodes]
MARGTQASPRDGYAKSSAKEATEIVLAARKTWKLMRSKREKVWPPLIEATLIEALQKYRPQSVTDIQLLQRFPKRNCWISKYIKRRTGHDRSPKQVGSRLQQLRDSCRDERILQLLSRKQYDDNDDNDSVTSYLACCEVHQCLIKRRLISDNDTDFLSLKEHHEDEVVHTVRYTFVDLRSTPPSTPSDEPVELWKPPLEETSYESPLNGSVTHASDALGLDAPAVHPKAESSRDGRAHFPVKEESHTPPSEFSPLSQDLSNGMPEPPVQSTQCLYELADHTQPTTYEFDFSITSSSANDMPALVYPSAYTATTFTPQCNHPLTISSTEWLQQGQWTAQGYRPQHPETMSSPHNKRYAYFWEQPISYAHISSYLGQADPLSYNSTASETQETQEPYAYAQPDYMMTPVGSAHSDYANDLYQRQDDRKMREGPCVVYENVSHSPCSDSSSELAYAPETLMTKSTYSHLPPPPYVCAPNNENGYQMCSSTQVWS